mmetsp:Transcript_4787/g.10173  ORF Transcript_4787/g.10173 Transcript_4787/m.10173 type:complete len:218 (-) Transcript_4787:266-919(-)
MKPSIVSVSLVFLFAVGGAQAKDFLFMNFVGWYENFHYSGKSCGKIEKDKNGETTGGTPQVGGGWRKLKKEKENKEGSYYSSRPSTGGFADPYASFDCNAAKVIKFGCDVTLVGVDSCDCQAQDSSRPTKLVKGKLSATQFEADKGVTDSIMFSVECCGASGCTPFQDQPQINLGIQQLPEDNNRDIRALAIFDLTDEDAIPDPEIVVRIGGGLKYE